MKEEINRAVKVIERKDASLIPKVRHKEHKFSRLPLQSEIKFFLQTETTNFYCGIPICI